MKLQALPSRWWAASARCCRRDQLLGRARLAPVGHVGIGDVGGRRHRHLGADRRELLHQLDIAQIERHAGVDVGIADLDHVGASKASPSCTSASIARRRASPSPPSSIALVGRELHARPSLPRSFAIRGAALAFCRTREP